MHRVNALLEKDMLDETGSAVCAAVRASDQQEVVDALRREVQRTNRQSRVAFVFLDSVLLVLLLFGLLRAPERLREIERVTTFWGDSSSMGARASWSLVPCIFSTAIYLLVGAPFILVVGSTPCLVCVVLGLAATPATLLLLPCFGITLAACSHYIVASSRSLLGMVADLEERTYKHKEV